MPPEQSDASWLWDMLHAGRSIEKFVVGKTLGDFQQDEMLQAAVERKIEIIGEAARKISDAFQDGHPEIPWRPIIAQRHILVHEYGEVRHELIWRVATIRIPELIRVLEPLVPLPPK
jgi:uncharacterized protein with HEPN domain